MPDRPPRQCRLRAGHARPSCKAPEWRRRQKRWQGVKNTRSFSPPVCRKLDGSNPTTWLHRLLHRRGELSPRVHRTEYELRHIMRLSCAFFTFDGLNSGGRCLTTRRDALAREAVPQWVQPHSSHQQGNIEMGSLLLEDTLGADPGAQSSIDEGAAP